MSAGGSRTGVSAEQSEEERAGMRAEANGGGAEQDRRKRLLRSGLPSVARKSARRKAG